MKFYLVPLRAEIDLDKPAVAYGAKASEYRDLPQIDYLAVDPMNTERRIEHRTLHVRPAILLHLSAYDCLTVLTAVGIVWQDRRGRLPAQREIYGLFIDNPHDALRAVCNLAANRALPGEMELAQKRQYLSNPEGWLSVQAGLMFGELNGSR